MQRSLPSSDLNGLSRADASRGAARPGDIGPKGACRRENRQVKQGGTADFTVLGQEMSPRAVFLFDSVTRKPNSGAPQREGLDDTKGTA